MMKRPRYWRWGLGLLSALVCLILTRPVAGGWTIADGWMMPAQSSVAIAQTTPTAVAVDAAALPALSGTYQDPKGLFEVGILEGYSVTPTAGALLVESPDRALAYTAMTRLRSTPGQLNPQVLAQIAIDVFQDGAGFVPGAVQTGTGGSAILPFTAQAGDQPLTGQVLVRQAETRILLLLVAGTETGASAVPQVLMTLSPSLKPLS